MARYRALSATGDYTFGQGKANFLVNSPAMVAQKIRTRLLLFQGEWFLNVLSGTPWYPLKPGTVGSQYITGKNVNPTYDLLIQQRILQTQGVQSIVSYSSTLDGVTRALSITVTVMTIYSTTPVTVSV